MDQPPLNHKSLSLWPSWKRHALATVSSLRSYPKKLAAAWGRSVHANHPTQQGDVAGLQSGALTDWHSHDLAASWLGHATVLLRVGAGASETNGQPAQGITILTDPVFSSQIGLPLGKRVIGVQRLAPAITSELPPIDLVLLSHAHFDHLDKPTLRAIASPKTTIVTARKTADLIPAGFANVYEMDWNEKFRFDREGASLEIEALKPEHWGARTAFDRRRGFNSYVLRTQPPADSASAGVSNGRTVFFAGDTGDTNAFDGVGPVDLAILGIGSYHPWEHMHATPEQAWGMFCRMGGKYLLPVHHSTFPLGHEPMDEPMQRLLAIAGKATGEDPGTDRIIHAKPGELWKI